MERSALDFIKEATAKPSEEKKMSTKKKVGIGVGTVGGLTTAGLLARKGEAMPAAAAASCPRGR